MVDEDFFEAPLSVSLEDVISTDEENNLSLFVNDEDTESIVSLESHDGIITNDNLFDLQPVVDPLDELLDQKTSLI